MTYQEKLNGLAEKFAKEYVESEPNEYIERMLPLAKIALEEMAECYILGYQQSCIDSDSAVVTHHHLLQSLGLVPQN